MRLPRDDYRGLLDRHGNWLNAEGTLRYLSDASPYVMDMTWLGADCKVPYRLRVVWRENVHGEGRWEFAADSR